MDGVAVCSSDLPNRDFSEGVMALAAKLQMNDSLLNLLSHIDMVSFRGENKQFQLSMSVVRHDMVDMTWHPQMFFCVLPPTFNSAPAPDKTESVFPLQERSFYLQ